MEEFLTSLGQDLMGEPGVLAYWLIFLTIVAWGNMITKRW